MGYSIFSSKQTWSSPRSKELVRTDVENEHQARQEMDRLLRQGHKINGVLPNDSDRPDARRRRS
ncbi:hypothetical protein [Dictyobacter kobayashii]|uniref:Uncharacterized protein n=1 Tax=Dictyobacter kobayashii TaxID=2014872 RepID=A0A402AMK7_9CHLR|nr:hypothetical protein [Dictyobacter kobayashii]GCE20363.1 hypothetical protein KDK_41630 [Dictyobacter kobayashii]